MFKPAIGPPSLPTGPSAFNKKPPKVKVPRAGIKLKKAKPVVPKVMPKIRGLGGLNNPGTPPQGGMF